MDKSNVIIYDLDGKEILVTDYEAAIAQAEACVRLHQEAEQAHQTDSTVIYYPDAHKHWAHILKQLQQL